MRHALTALLCASLAASTAAAAPAAATDQEAWNLAVQVSHRLQPSEKLMALVSKMIGAARAAERAIESTPISGPGWSTTQVMVTLEEGHELAPALAPFAEDLGAYEVRPFSFGNMVLVKWEEPLNVPALKKKLEERPGVASVSLDRIIGSSSSVSLKAEGGGYRMTFFQGSGDCPAGCIHKKFWRFRFDGQGNLIGQEVDESGPKGGKPGPDGKPSPGGGPAVMPGLGPGLGVTIEGGPVREGLPEPAPQVDEEPEVEFPSAGRPGGR